MPENRVAQKYGYGSKPWQLMNPSKWMLIPLKLIIIGFGPFPYDG
jgi:hypothetical protein